MSSEINVKSSEKISLFALFAYIKNEDAYFFLLNQGFNTDEGYLNTEKLHVCLFFCMYFILQYVCFQINKNVTFKMANGSLFMKLQLIFMFYVCSVCPFKYHVKNNAPPSASIEKHMLFKVVHPKMKTKFEKKEHKSEKRTQKIQSSFRQIHVNFVCKA